MFARRVDPFPSFNPVFPSPETRLKNMSSQTERRQTLRKQAPYGAYDGGFQYHSKDQQRQSDQDFGHDFVPPQMDSSSSSSLHRKRSFHFEPEFVEALDASLHEPSRPRALKKLRRTAAVHHDPHPHAAASANTAAASYATTAAVLDQQEPRPSRKSFPTKRFSDGPSIIDLSSGEELEALHLGENEHKRRRESVADSSSSESLREVYDVLEDGTLCPVMDHAPAKPSPMKRLRTEKRPSSKLVSLDDLETGKRPPLCRTPPNHITSDEDILDSDRRDRKGMNNHQDDLSQMDMSVDVASSTARPPAPIADRGALIRYEGPKTMTLADGVEGLLKHQWSESQKEPPTLLNAQGNEMVLYRRPPPSIPDLHDDDDSFGSTARIEELDDDDIYTSQTIQDGPIRELEEGIMDMDLD
ncbi:hypothetical protein B0O80DRAFT_448891 [Mortierella sp. GBAus27b]|nr:hypothetical protein BGX31_007796 [Mortierella sp. GBA43]KAI8355270.1 hypothetical protein B0O80DRAFT_448891 [Mortierella sp. GBAus27b]